MAETGISPSLASGLVQRDLSLTILWTNIDEPLWEKRRGLR